MEGKGSIKVDIRDDKNAVVIDVSDTGKGYFQAEYNQGVQAQGLLSPRKEGGG